MRKKIFGLIILLLLGGGVFLWWLGNRTIVSEQKRAEEARQLEIKQTQEIQTKLEAQIRSVPTSTLQTITTAMAQKQAPLNTLETAEIIKNQYTLIDFQIAKQETASTRQTYKTRIKTILTNYSQKLVGDETGALVNYLETRDQSQLKIIQDTKDNLDQTIQALVGLTIPGSAAFLHAQLVNSLASLRQIIYNMSQAEREPLIATESADRRQKAYLDVLYTISALDRYLANPIIKP